MGTPNNPRHLTVLLLKQPWLLGVPLFQETSIYANHHSCCGHFPQQTTQELNLVGGFNPSEKYEFVSWDDEIPNIWTNT